MILSSLACLINTYEYIEILILSIFSILDLSVGTVCTRIATKLYVLTA